MYNLPGDNETINYESAWEEVESLEQILRHRTGDVSICIGIGELGKYDCEYWVEADFLKQSYFNNLDDVESYVRENYAEWNE